MKGLIDIHCHILHGIDDGAKDMEEALAMARAAWEAGIFEIIATPHFEEYVFENYREQILEKIEEFNKELQLEKIPVKIHPGCEIMLTPNIPKLIKKGKLLTLKDEGKYVLIEFPRSMWLLYAEDILHELKIMGLTPIIAHPERYRKIPETVLEDNLLQINLGSIRGKYGSRAKDKVEVIRKLKANKEIFYASDAHRAEVYKANGSYNELMSSAEELGKMDSWKDGKWKVG